MTNISVMKYSMKLLEVLSILSKTSKALQDRNMHIANAQDSISSTFQLLNIISSKDNCFTKEIRKIQLHANETEYINARDLPHHNLQAKLKNSLLEDTEGVFKEVKIISFKFQARQKRL